MKKIHYTMSAVLLGCTLASVVQAGSLHATIVEENRGAIGNVSWTVMDEKGFVPVHNGTGQNIQLNLKPGRYLISVHGDTQGQASVNIDKGHKSIQVKTRKFY